MIGSKKKNIVAPYAVQILNYKYKIYTLILTGYNLYLFVTRYNFNNEYIDLYNDFLQCEQNNTNLETMIEYQDKNHKLNRMV